MQELQPPEILYHYTTTDTLFSILQNLKKEAREDAQRDELSYYKFTLWASHILYCNDPIEYDFYFECLGDALKQDLFGEPADPLLPGKILKFIEALDIFNPAILSLSESQDNLPMWRGYSNNGQGVSIGFKTDILKEAFGENTEFVKCIYRSSEQLVEEINLQEIKDAVIEEDGTFSLGDKIPGLLFERRKKYKHAAYEYEKEWRLYLNNPVEYKYRMRNGLIIPYIELELPFSVIDSICIGPTAAPDLSENSLEMILHSKLSNLDREIKLSISDIPFTIL